MKYLIILTPLLLLGCHDDDNCDGVQKANHWLTDAVTTHAQLTLEINEVIVENKCSGITAEKLRKVLLDMERLAKEGK
jgi:hypothetical protein